MAKVIAICNQKGGVGKTTSAVNLAAGLSALEKRVLLVDMDPQGNASQGVGVFDYHDVDVYTLLTAAGNPEELTEELLGASIQDTEMEYLKVLPSTPNLAGLETELVNALNRERRLDTVLKMLNDYFDYIIVDSPPSLGWLTINVLTCAQSVIIPIQCEYYALQGLAELSNTIRLVQKSLNSELRIEGALLTMYDSRLTLSKQVAEEVRNDFSEKVFETVIPRNVKLSEAPSFGKPILLYDIVSAGSKRYMDLAEELLQMNGDAT
ncbi:MAG: ParA family protein [Fibrobacterales bacterium]